MHFGSKAKKMTHSCKVEGYVIENVHTYKYLGFLLDQELTFKADLSRLSELFLRNSICLKNSNIS